ncbi:cupin domain-containing protein [Salegentibacter sediminis]|uniref:cupin domain-containing protein n=1 Tax=Salegentibacter sediminis TaxID=1930251 RepID=UPI0009BCA75A|nr:cupin domain-containing protein [Salegentibacter sediminis]
MKSASLSKNLNYNDSKSAVEILLDTDSSKEIRILMKKGQVMKEHKTSYPIMVEIFEGKVSFGVNGKIHHLEKGDLVSLEASIPHDLTATEDSTIRLSLSKADSVERVKEVAKKS